MAGTIAQLGRRASVLGEASYYPPTNNLAALRGGLLFALPIAQPDDNDERLPDLHN
jgi:hypothetical protein